MLCILTLGIRNGIVGWLLGRQATSASLLLFWFGGERVHDQSTSNYVRCVRGREITRSPKERLFPMESADEAVIVDRATGLIWQLGHEVSIIWSDALAYCAHLDEAGFDDWRLPNLQELRTLLDVNKSPKSDHPTIVGTRYWSSTADLCSIDDLGVWYIDFDGGELGGSEKEWLENAICVRGGP